MMMGLLVSLAAEVQTVTRLRQRTGEVAAGPAKGLLNDNCFDYGGGFGSIV
jgi:hypothetical protein